MKRRIAIAMCAAVALSGRAFAADAEAKTDKEAHNTASRVDIGGNLNGNPSSRSGPAGKGVKDWLRRWKGDPHRG